MLRESYEAQIIPRGPAFNLTIITTSDQQSPILRIIGTIQIKVVALLFEYIRFTLPFPNKELTF
jgi:hypothetical protein